MSTTTNEEAMTDEEEQFALDESGEVTLPLVDVLRGRGAIFGKAGSGKSNTASVVLEEILSRGHAAFVVDTDGEYWGLKEDYEVLHVGADEQCDLRVGPEHGGKLAELALEQNVPIILDVSGYIDSEKRDELVFQCARELFVREKDAKKPLPLLVEEIHEYVPQQGGLGEVGEMLVRVAKRGRKRGLGIIGISQRPADVSKDLITQCQWFCWHRLTWENDTKVVKRVVGNDYADAVQDLGDGEGFLMADWFEDIRRVQVRRKHTFDAGAAPGLSDTGRPDLKSVSGDLVDELEEISEQQSRRQDRIAKLEARLEEKDEEIAALADQLEAEKQNNETVERLADKLADAAAGGEGGGEALEEIREEKNAEIRGLENELEAREERIKELEGEVSELQQELQQRPDVSERAVEAVEVLAEEFGAGGEDAQKLREKLKSARERIDELEGRQPSADDLDSDPLENRKVQSVVHDVESRLNDLGEKEQQMLRYYLVSGPASMKDAYKYAGGSPTSGAKSQKTRALRDAGLVKKVGRGEYTFGLREYLGDVLSDFTEEEIDRVHDHLEEKVYDTVMEEANVA